MTEPSAPPAAPGAPRPGPPSAAAPPDVPAPGAPAPDAPVQGAARRDDAERPFADLERRPIAEHPPVFEAEHARLENELASIDQL